jgi:protein-tyrosine phosphatase|eukprot:Transcript_14960.p3 GENE.Transcript_14960~~Transcript_14960.p3  ORF type:complete len:269 (+),score=94.19 Transcript_14960:86-808(+)
MGAVHGVHLKYVAMSVASATAARSIDSEARMLMWAALCYCAMLHAFIAACFVLRMGMSLMGKSPQTGQVPWWSYVAFWGFHLPTWLYTDLHTRHSVHRGTPVATEVVPGWWIGGRYGDKLKKKWAVTIDLTCEFPEACRDVTGEYLLLPCWDGVPPTPAQIEQAAQLAAQGSRDGDVMVHCAHGRGRSTCVMVACLVAAGLFADWEAAFAACKAKRKVVSLNKKMRRALTEWQERYVVAK